jgi:hypothetical protein
MIAPDNTTLIQIFDALKRGQHLTALDAMLEFKTMRLAAYIHELRRRGNTIASVRENNGRKWWVRYALEKLAQEEAQR